MGILGQREDIFATSTYYKIKELRDYLPYRENEIKYYARRRGPLNRVEIIIIQG